MQYQLDYDPQSEFESARDMLKYYVGLELCLMQQVILRKIVVDTINELSSIELSRNAFRPSVEGAVRFLMKEYGLTTQDKSLYEPIIGGYYDKNVSAILNHLQSKTIYP